MGFDSQDASLTRRTGMSYVGTVECPAHRTMASNPATMSHSAPNSRCATPPSATRGGSRPGSGQRSKKRAHCGAAAAAGGVAFVASLRHQQRLQEGIVSLSNAPGRSLRSNELRVILRVALWLQRHEGFTEAAAIETASVWAGSSRHSVEPAYRHWWDTGELLDPDASQRGRGNPEHPQHDSSLSLQQILAIHSLLTDSKAKDEFMPAREIRARLHLPLSIRQTRRLLRQLGYKWGRKRAIGKAGRQHQTMRLRSFIRQLAEALQQERDGTAVIGCTDESYLHTAHSNKYCWYSPASPARNQVSGTPSKGKRFILLHAMTKHGLLTAPRRGRSSAAPSNVVSDEDLGCELIFEGLIDSEDYHKNMDGQVFMQWVHNRLIPTFKCCFPGKKLILLLDNAAYHHPRGADWINPNKMSKYELAVWISDRAESITVQRDGASKYFGKASLFQPASRYAPTVDEMRGWVKAYLLQHPSLNRTLLRQAFDAEGWQLLYTPPYCCECQPIELLWAHVKNYVGRQMGSDHSIPTVTQLARKGFYGDASTNHAPADASLCTRLFDHAYAWCNAFIAADTELTGTLEQLSDIYTPADDSFDDIDDESEAQAMQLSGGGWSEEESSDDEA